MAEDEYRSLDCQLRHTQVVVNSGRLKSYDSMSDLGEIRVYQRADFQSGSRVLKKVF